MTDQEKQSIAGFDLKKMSNTIFSEEGMQNNFKQTREINPERLKESVDKVEIYGTELVDLDKAINLNSYIGEFSFTNLDIFYLSVKTIER